MWSWFQNYFFYSLDSLLVPFIGSLFHLLSIYCQSLKRINQKCQTEKRIFFSVFDQNINIKIDNGRLKTKPNNNNDTVHNHVGSSTVQFSDLNESENKKENLADDKGNKQLNNKQAIECDGDDVTTRDLAASIRRYCADSIFQLCNRVFLEKLSTKLGLPDIGLYHIYEVLKLGEAKIGNYRTTEGPQKNVRLCSYCIRIFLIYFFHLIFYYFVCRDKWTSHWLWRCSHSGRLSWIRGIEGFTQGKETQWAVSFIQSFFLVPAFFTILQLFSFQSACFSGQGNLWRNLCVFRTRQCWRLERAMEAGSDVKRSRWQ